MATLSIQLSSKPHDHQLTILIDANKQLIEANGQVHWKNESQGWRIRLDPVTITNKDVQYSGQSVIHLDEDGSVYATVEGSGNAYGVALSGFQANYTNQNQTQFSMKGLLKGGMLQKYFPGTLTFSVNSKNNRTKINLNNANISGNILIDKYARYFITANLNYLYFQLNSGSGQPIALDPRVIPSLLLNVHHFYLNHQELGDIRLDSFPIKNGLKTRISLCAPFIQLCTVGNWTRVGKNDYTEFSGGIKAKDFGKWMSRAHAIDRIKGGTFLSQFDFHANVSPFNLTLENMTGKTDVSLKKAVILSHKRGSKKNNVRINDILNIISLDFVTSFITFDFSSLRKQSEGFEILWMAGEVSLKNGWLETKKVKLQSPSAEIDFSGTIHLTTGHNHLLMTVYPNLIPKESLDYHNPFMLIIRLPVWLWKKITSWFFDPFFHLDYRITGTLSKPIVKRA